jgi:hypothetical protein
MQETRNILYVPNGGGSGVTMLTLINQTNI